MKKESCDICELKKFKKKTFLWGKGMPLKKADLLIIGEAPGKNEVKKHTIFVGKSGKLLNKLLVPLMNKYHYRVHITSAVKCVDLDHPTPGAKTIALCRKLYLEKEIEKFRGDKIVTLGKIAAQSIRGKKRRMRDLIGHPEYLYNKLVLSVWHPAAYLYSGYKQILIDIHRALRWGLR